MPWYVSLHTDALIVETTYAGLVFPVELQAASRKILAVAQESGHRLLLSDCTALEGGHSLGDLYFLVQDLATSPQNHSLKEALVLPELAVAQALVRFWETTASNWGLRVRCFEQRQAAIAWLLQD